ncbi:MAG: sigma 54-dependent Fis family transcriptional regulator [Deltaproteobacteria bacterium]|nr:sigma 54-dependent Fis family transcriptional regulator [Deltaproteobacteria bacterium]
MSRTVAHHVPTVPVRRLRAQVLSGPDAGRGHVAAADTITVGTAPGNDLVLTDETVSGYHLELRCEQNRILATDHGSTNGTRLGAVWIERAAIPPATVLMLGRTELRIEDEGTVDCEILGGDHLGQVRGRSSVMRRLLATVDRAARSDTSVLLIGETGTGKEVLARALHEASPRRERPFETVDCGALIPTLTASELFGHERGAFTGAEQQHVGAFERAHGGSVFLDEIGELPPSIQVMLLGVLERRVMKRLGGKNAIPVDVRVVAATNRDLREEVNKGTFRQDLYYRIAVLTLRVPPLRERLDDIPLLVEHFLREDGYSGPIEAVIGPSVLASLSSHRWPGNVRELRNFVAVARAMGEAPALSGEDAGASRPKAGETGELGVEIQLRGLENQRPLYKELREVVVRKFEEIFLAHLMERTRGNVAKAAREAEMDRNYLTQLLDRHGLRGKGP